MVLAEAAFMKKLVLLTGLLCQINFGMENNQKISNLENSNIGMNQTDINIYIYLKYNKVYLIKSMIITILLNQDGLTL